MKQIPSCTHVLEKYSYEYDFQYFLEITKLCTSSWVACWIKGDMTGNVTLSQNVSCLEEGRMCHMHVHTVLRRPLTSQTVGATGKALSRLLGPFPDPSAFITLHPSNPAAHNAALWENAWAAVTSRMQPALPLSRCYITVCSFFFLFSSCRFWGSVRRWWHPVTSSPKCLHSNDGSYPNHFTTIFFFPLPQYFFFLSDTKPIVYRLMTYNFLS